MRSAQEKVSEVSAEVGLTVLGAPLDPLKALLLRLSVLKGA